MHYAVVKTCNPTQRQKKRVEELLSKLEQEPEPVGKQARTLKGNEQLKYLTQLVELLVQAPV